MELNFKERIENIKKEEINTLKDVLVAHNSKYIFPYDGECEMPTILVGLDMINNLIVSVVVTSLTMDDDCKVTINGNCEEFGNVSFSPNDVFAGEIERIIECILLNEDE